MTEERGHILPGGRRGRNLLFGYVQQEIPDLFSAIRQLAERMRQE
jgi:hypothetical protein